MNRKNKSILLPVQMRRRTDNEAVSESYTEQPTGESVDLTEPEQPTSRSEVTGDTRITMDFGGTKVSATLLLRLRFWLTKWYAK